AAVRFPGARRPEPVHSTPGGASRPAGGDDSLLMIARYTRPEMGRIFSDENRFAQWLEVELATTEALAELGQVPADAARALRHDAAFDVQRIHEIEREVKHDVIAFTTAVAERMAAAGQADASRWFHYGLTSNDVVDTAQALVLQEASSLLRKGSE